MKTLVVLTGPTGVGKTALSLQLAEWLHSPILSCDSRQMFREMCIGTAAPTTEELTRVPHHFVGTLSIHDYYSAARFELDALSLLDELFRSHDTVLMTGGSMMYIDAVCKGIDDMPDVDPALRTKLQERLKQEGLEALLAELSTLDPIYYARVDKSNHKRILHGLEICLMTGKPFSSFHLHSPKQRPFNIIKICLNINRTLLYERIDNRVFQMVNIGLVEEARALYPFKHLNALNTVGYKELFDFFDGVGTLEKAIANIQFNTHKYARKQLTWFRRDPTYHWFSPDDLDAIKSLIEQAHD